MKLLMLQTTSADYSVDSGALSGIIQAGMTEDSLTITITNDEENEGNETFKVRLKGLSGAVFAGGGMTHDVDVTILIMKIQCCHLKQENLIP